MTEFTIQVRDLKKSYGNFEAVRGVSFNVEKGEIFALLGPNGAGKTTLMRIINQITAPDSGSLLFDGMPLTKHHAHTQVCA